MHEGIKDSLSVYIHWPFCRARCSYCNFNRYTNRDVDEELFLNAYLKSIDYYIGILPNRKVSTVFFGGGTPSMMSAASVGRIIDKIADKWDLDSDAEISLEANPVTNAGEKFASLRAAGINRLSLGVQSLLDDDLKMLGRAHDAQGAIKAIEVADKNFDRFSIDMIYARPNQSLELWEAELGQALSLSGKHISLYQLTLEQGTPFHTRYKRGEFDLPDEDMQAEFFNLTQEITQNAGVPAYEVSNHASAGEECRHNLVYWNMHDYIGIGAGAHGRFTIGEKKYANVDYKTPDKWVREVTENGNGIEKSDTLSTKEQFYELVIMGLRLRDGISIKQMEKRTGINTDNLFDMGKVAHVKDQGWCDMGSENDRIRLTREGMLRINAIIPYITK